MLLTTLFLSPFPFPNLGTHLSCKSSSAEPQITRKTILKGKQGREIPFAKIWGCCTLAGGYLGAAFPVPGGNRGIRTAPVTASPEFPRNSFSLNSYGESGTERSVVTAGLCLGGILAIPKITRERSLAGTQQPGEEGINPVNSGIPGLGRSGFL